MKRIGSPKNGNMRAFFAKCRESSVRAFRKKTPISVRRCGEGGAKGGAEKVRSFVTFSTDGFPNNYFMDKIDVRGEMEQTLNNKNTPSETGRLNIKQTTQNIRIPMFIVRQTMIQQFTKGVKLTLGINTFSYSNSNNQYALTNLGKSYEYL